MLPNWSNLKFKNSVPFSEKFQDFYFSKNDPIGLKESYHNFILGSQLEKKLKKQKKQQFIIGELGFGTGINFFNTTKLFTNSHHKLHFISCEKFPLSQKSLKKFYYTLPKKEQTLALAFLNQYPLLPEGIFMLHFFNNVKLTLFFGDVKDFFPLIQKPCDLWFLDGFNPKNNPSMWDEEVLKCLKTKTTNGGTLHTFSVQGNLRRNLQKQGFLVKKIKGYATKRECLWAQKNTIDEKDYTPAWFHYQRSRNIKVKKAIVLGAGIAGTSIANALAHRNWKVLVYDKNSSFAQGTSSLPYALVKPKIFLDHKALINQFAYFSFPFAFKKINQLHKKYGNIIYQKGIKEKISKKKSIELTKLAKKFTTEIVRVKGLDFYYPNALIIQPQNLCESLLLNGGKNIEFYYNQKVAKIEKIKNQWCIFDEKNHCLERANVLILANAFEGILGFPLPLDNDQITLNYGYIFHTNLQIKESFLKEKKYAIKTSDGSFLGSSFSLKQEKPNKKFLELCKETFLNYSQENLLKAYKGKRIYTKDSFPLVGEINFEDEFKKKYADLWKGKKAWWYPKISETGLFLFSAFGSRGMSYSLISSELLASQLNGESLVFPTKILEKLEPNRLFVNLAKKL